MTSPPPSPSTFHNLNRRPSNTSHLTTASSHAYHIPSCQTDPNEECEHGVLSPHATRRGSASSFAPLFDGLNPNGHGGHEVEYEPAGHGGRVIGERDLTHGILGDAVADGVLGDGTGGQGPPDGKGGQSGMSTTQWLARGHGVRGRRTMYLAYYFPFLNWISQYRWAYLKGDLIAALTMASFYIPMSLSYAANLGHIPPINGLYSFVFNPFIYALLGTCPQMVMGPEAAGSLLVGTVVRDSVDSGYSGDDDDDMNARIAGVVTGMAGAVIFIAGLCRLGFLDSVLSRPFLRGFISAIGFVILVDQIIPEMGLTHRGKQVGGISHGSSVQKIVFLVTNVRYAHGLTCGVAFGSFAIIMVCRYGDNAGWKSGKECADRLDVQAT